MFKLLIVDDFFIERENVKDIIGESGLDIQVCGECDNGLEALKVMDELKPDFVLTDVEMPFMNGLELAREMQVSYPDITVIMFSFYDKFEYVKKALDTETFAYILKPIISEELIRTFEKLIVQKRSEFDRYKKEADLMRLVEDSKPMLRNNFIKELFEGKYKLTTKIIEKFHYFHIAYAHNTYRVVVLELDNYEEVIQDMNYKQREMLHIRVDQMMGHYGEEHLSLWTRIDRRHWAFLTWFGREDQSDLEDAIYDACDRIYESLQNINICVSYGISNIFEQMVEIPKAVKQGHMALAYKFNYKRGQIIQYDEIMGIERDYEIDLGRIQKEVKEILLSANEGAGLKFVRELFLDMGPKVPQETVRSLCFGIITAMQVSLENQFVTFNDVFGKKDIVWEKLIRFETIYDVENWLKNMLTFSIRYISEQKRSEDHKISDEVKEYIHKNYNQSITVKDIAEAMFYNPNYLNNVFKEETGTTILDYITRHRIDKAKEMLSQSDTMKVKEVAATVGYSNGAYFRSLFKRHVGMSPKDYRQAVRRCEH